MPERCPYFRERTEEVSTGDVLRQAYCLHKHSPVRSSSRRIAARKSAAGGCCGRRSLRSGRLRRLRAEREGFFLVIDVKFAAAPRWRNW